MPESVFWENRGLFIKQCNCLVFFRFCSDRILLAECKQTLAKVVLPRSIALAIAIHQLFAALCRDSAPVEEVIHFLQIGLGSRRNATAEGALWGVSREEKRLVAFERGDQSACQTSTHPDSFVRDL